MAKSTQRTKKPLVLRIFFWELFLFLLTFVLGLFSAVEVQKVLKEEEIVLPSLSLGNFIAYFLFATLIILALVYLPKIKRIKGTIYKFFFIFASAYGGLLVLSLFLIDIFSLLLVVILIYLWLKHPNIVVHDFLMILGMAGIGAMLGLSFQPEIVVLLLVALSLYDFIAVYKTKHMIKMAKSMLEQGVIMGLIIPPKLSDFWEDVNQVKPGGKFVILGGGDIVFPLLFSVSLIPQGIFKALIVALFALLGAAFSFAIFVFQKKREPIPALPPIALLSIIGYIITLLI